MNTSNDTGEIESQFGYFSFFATVLELLPVGIVNFVLLVTLVTEKSLPSSIRLILACLISSCEVVIFSLAITFISNLLISGFEELQPSENLCKVLLWLVLSGGAARLVFMSLFAINVFILVKYSAKALKFYITVAVAGIIVLLTFLPNLAVFSSLIVTITFIDDTVCSFHGSGEIYSYAYAVGYTFIYGICSVGFTIVIPIITLAYLKKRSSITEDNRVNRAMIKFTFFLLLGNSFNLIGQSGPVFLAVFLPSDTGGIVQIFSYIEGVFLLISLIPTPIMILVYFKPVRERLGNCLCRHFCQCCVDLYEQRYVYEVSSKNSQVFTTSSSFDCKV